MSFLHWPSFLLPGRWLLLSAASVSRAVLISAISVKRVFWAVNSLASQFPAPPEINSDYDQTRSNV